MKTAMQELIEYLENMDYKERSIYKLANILLEKEKEQIMKAVEDTYDSTYNSCESGCGGNMEIDFTPLEYYNQVYDQNK